MARGSSQKRLVTVLALVVASSMALAGTGAVLASHGAENGNYTVVFPDENPAPGAQGVSVNHYAAATQEAFEKNNAPNYVNMSWIVISSQDVDFTDCSTEDTRAFGIDRGNNNSGTETDQDLLRYRKNSQFKDNKITVEFYQQDDTSPARPDDAPPTLYPVDEIVAAQNACYGMPEEAGWYQIQGYMNGSNSNGEFVEVNIPSHYFYVCDCANEQEARNKLGPPPSEQDGNGQQDDGQQDDGQQDDGQQDDGQQNDGQQQDDGQQNDGQQNDGQQQDDGQQNDGQNSPTDGTPTDGNATDSTPTDDDGDVGGTDDGAGGDDGEATTPTEGGGPGFGVIAAIGALLAAAALAIRRD